MQPAHLEESQGQRKWSGPRPPAPELGTGDSGLGGSGSWGGRGRGHRLGVRAQVRPDLLTEDLSGWCLNLFSSTGEVEPRSPYSLRAISMASVAFIIESRSFP